jgi:hypothetical protein
MKGFYPMKIALFTLDNYYLWSQIAVVLAGAAALITGKMVNDRQSKTNADLETNLMEQRERTAQAELQIAKAQESAANAQRDLETERGKRLEMEKSFAPRSLQFILSDTPNFEPLKKFAGINVILWYLPDAEAIRATNHIIQLITFAGWNLVSKEPRPELSAGYFDGVSVEVRSRKDPTDLESAKEILRREEAADALIEFLESNNWYAHKTFADNPLPNNTIKICVGFKPSPYFFPEWVKKGAQKGKEVRQQLKEWKQREEELRKQLPQQPPQDK